MKPNTLSLVLFVLLTYFAVSPIAQAVVPPPDGGYPNFTTAEGTNAVKNLTTGAANTAVGWFSLFGDTTASFNTAVGAGTLLFNNGDSNTAVGVAALLSNTTGYENTATGAFALSSNTEGRLNTANGVALFSNSTGQLNTAIGAAALNRNTIGYNNTAVGYAAMLGNTTGPANTAMGSFALNSNTEGISNVAVGESALSSNSTGGENTATGVDALSSNTEGIRNTANGAQALVSNTTGSDNTVLGYGAGFSLTTGNGNVCIGAGVVGVAGEDSTTRIRNIFGSVAGDRAVYVNSDNKIGTLASSRRFKEEIKPMEKASEVLFALKPVSFRYKKEFDAGRAPMFGRIAEDVEQVDSDLVSRNDKGEVDTVRYEQINAMLLNEFLNEHRKNEEQQATIAQLKKDLQTNAAQQQKQIDALSAALQKVSAQLETRKPAPQVVNNP